VSQEAGRLLSLVLIVVPVSPSVEQSHRRQVLLGSDAHSRVATDANDGIESSWMDGNPCVVLVIDM
jgi:hypothetical protein